MGTRLILKPEVVPHKLLERPAEHDNDKGQVRISQLSRSLKKQKLENLATFTKTSSIKQVKEPIKRQPVIRNKPPVYPSRPRLLLPKIPDLHYLPILRLVHCLVWKTMQSVAK